MPKIPLAILTIPNPRLRKRAEDIDAATLEKFRRDGFLDKLVETMEIADGVGIAATQVGVLHRIIVVLNGNTPTVYVNPTITSRSMRTAIDVEGCLSVPGIVGTVRRARNITVRARNDRFEPVALRCKALVARIFQHEVDHLDGVLFIDRAISTSEVPKRAGSELRV